MKRKAPTEDGDNGQPPKRQKTSNKEKPIERKPIHDFNTNEIKQLVRLFSHLESEKIQNQTLDRCIYDAYKTLSSILDPVK